VSKTSENVIHGTFDAFERPDGTFGARSHVAILPSVGCAVEVADRIARAVEGTEAVLHHQGCCQMPPDLDRITNALVGLGRNPNVAAVLVVSLGCEGVDAAVVAARIKESGKPVELISIQELGGTVRAVDAGTKIAVRLAREVMTPPRGSAPLSGLTVGVKCGGSDATSGLASNPAVGRALDRLLETGGTAIFGETTEFIGAEDALAGRCATPEAGAALLAAVRATEARANALGVDMRGGQPTPGNIAGGLTTIEEKSLGAIVKSGSQPIQGMLEYGQAPPGPGLWAMDTPGREIEVLAGLAAAGAQVILFSTGRGVPQGFPLAPVVKVCGNPATCRHMADEIDFDASGILEGTKTVNEVGDELFDLLLSVASGKATKSEEIGYTNPVDFHVLGPVL
jgi:altronate dehydratase large subunit